MNLVRGTATPANLKELVRLESRCFRHPGERFHLRQIRRLLENPRAGVVFAREGGEIARPGLLVALRGVELHCLRIDDLPGALECEAEVLAEGEDSQQYAFRIRHVGALLAEGRAAVMLQAGP